MTGCHPIHLTRYWFALKIEPVPIKRYKLACAAIKDSDQPAHPPSQVRVFDRRSMGSHGSNVY